MVFIIRVCAISHTGEVTYDLTIEEAQQEHVSWCWIDLSEPTEEEYMHVLRDIFCFHPLAIEDCLEYVQRPKIDFYNGYHFLVLHALSRENLEPYEIDLFVSERYVVSFHFHEDKAIERTWEKISERTRVQKSPLHLTHMIIDQLVDNYFSPVYFLEDRLNDIDDSLTRDSSRQVLEEVFDIRSDLSKLRRTIVPMRDLLYRILNSERFYNVSEHEIYFKDIHDHLLKLAEMIEMNRELTADIRDSCFSLNSNYMNSIMKTLTVFSTIFMPLTFIAGVYGMNFQFMPELGWKYGYFGSLLLMGFIVTVMIFWFRKKGWFK